MRINSFTLSGLVAATTWTCITSHAALLNDGTTLDNLARIKNAFGFDVAVTSATVIEGAINVTQSPEGFPFVPDVAP